MEDDRSRARSKKGNNDRNRTPARSSSTVTQQQDTSQTRTVNRTIHKEVVLDHKTFIVGSSQLAANLAARLDATCIPAVTDDNSFGFFKGKLAEEPGLVKVVFIDCWASDFSDNPDFVIAIHARNCRSCDGQVCAPQA